MANIVFVSTYVSLQLPQRPGNLLPSGEEKGILSFDFLHTICRGVKDTMLLSVAVLQENLLCTILATDGC
jgi:hypothetical protein